jgi:para-nitrobenzyl esterase
MHIRLFGLLLLIACIARPPAAASDELVRVESGMLAGISGPDSAVRVFKGVPYAAPPVGNLRWRAPQRPLPWSGVRRADHFSASCMQGPPRTFGPYTPEYLIPAEPISEDCLCLNVWTASQSAQERRPVLVWIHGGGFGSGSASVPIYDGEALAKKGVVFVGINYRLGPFGYLAHPDLTKESGHNSSGNYGILDMIAALQWVQRNIPAFGGDPKRVTIAGQSAGSFAVSYLAASPLARGLFHRIIAESGSALGVNAVSPPKLATAEQVGLEYAKSKGAASIQELRAKTAAELVDSGQPGQSLGFRPVIDGYVLPMDVYMIFAQGKQNDVPILVGWNADEGSLSSGASITAETFRDQVRKKFGAVADAFLKAYPARSDDEARISQQFSSRDETFGSSMRIWVRMQAKTGKSKGYLYFFTHVSPVAPGEANPGAFHTSEVPYVFNCLDKWNRPWQATDRKMADLMSSYWVNFVSKGDPNGKNLPRWPAYETKNDEVMQLGDKVGPMPMPNKAGFVFFEEYFAKKRGE